MHTDRLSTTILANLLDNISRTNLFGSWGKDFSFFGNIELTNDNTLSTLAEIDF